MLVIACWLAALNMFSINNDYAAPDTSYYGWPVHIFIYKAQVMQGVNANHFETDQWSLWIYKWLLPSVCYWVAMIVLPGIAWEWQARRRKRLGISWQLHLSTLVNLTFVTGVILWINTRIVVQERSVIRGWPFPYWEEVTASNELIQAGVKCKSATGLALDSIIAVAGLVMIAVVSEFIIRRRFHKRTALP